MNVDPNNSYSNTEDGVSNFNNTVNSPNEPIYSYNTSSLGGTTGIATNVSVPPSTVPVEQDFKFKSKNRFFDLNLRFKDNNFEKRYNVYSLVKQF